MPPVAAIAALALVGGASLALLFEIPTSVPAGALAAATGGALVLWWRATPWMLASAAAAFVAAGVLLGTAAVRDALFPSVLPFADQGPLLLEGRLREDAVPGEFGVIVPLDVERVFLREKAVSANGGVRLSIGGELAPRQMDSWRAGRTVRVTATLRRPLPYRNFGTQDQEHRLALRGIRLFGSVKSAALVEVVAPGSPLAEAAAAVRAWCRRTLRDAFRGRDPQEAAIVIAVLLGDRAGLDPDVEERLRRAGTYHVLAISGGNIAIMAALALWTFGRAGLAPRLRAAGTAALLTAYALVIIPGSSVVRATLAAGTYLIARALDLRSLPHNVIALAAALLMLGAPLSAADAGFWLTFFASFAILEQTGAFADTTRRVLARVAPSLAGAAPTPVYALFAATVAAEGTLLPITAYAFAQVTVAGLALNFIAVPLMTVVQCAGLAVLALSATHGSLAVPAVLAAGWAASAIVESARLVALAPWSAWTVAPPPIWLAGLAVAAWWGAWFTRTPRRRGGAVLVWAGAVLMISTGHPVWLPELPLRDRPCAVPAVPADGDGERLRVTFLDVGQGDATLIRLPDGTSWLVDAGGSPPGSRFDVGARVVAPALWAQGLRRLSTVALSHLDLDHVGGAVGVLQRLPPCRVVEGVPVAGQAVARRIREAADGAGASREHVARGARIEAGSTTLLVHHPPPPDWERRRVRNDDSIVFELRQGGVSIVLPGDIGGAVEREIAAGFDPAAVRILKASHHGSRTSTTTGFLQTLAPAVVVVSAGRDNRHGHPAPAMVARVRESGARLLRTDRDGAIQIDTDGRRVWITTCGGEHLVLSSAN